MKELKTKKASYPLEDYKEWILDLKEKIRTVQLKAAIQVNTELLTLYWEMGIMIVQKQTTAKWGDGFISNLSKDLSKEFPDIKGFSLSNIKYIRQWYLFYSNYQSISQQLVGQLEKSHKHLLGITAQENKTIHLIKSLLFQLPWGHNVLIVSKINCLDEAIFYIIKTIENNWSRNILSHQVESDLYKRQSKSLSNFSLTLPKPQSDLAHESLKNPYVFDFLSLTEKTRETDLEKALLNNIISFLLELGSGFSFIGKQKLLVVANEEFYPDLVFYHTKLHCYFLVELKIGRFKPEYAGKLSFYLSVFDKQVKSERDNPTIGLLLCKTTNRIIVEYSLRNVGKPIGVSEYKLTKTLPVDFINSLPSIEELENELTTNKENIKHVNALSINKTSGRKKL